MATSALGCSSTITLARLNRRPSARNQPQSALASWTSTSHYTTWSHGIEKDDGLGKKTQKARGIEISQRYTCNNYPIVKLDPSNYLPQLTPSHYVNTAARKAATARNTIDSLLFISAPDGTITAGERVVSTATMLACPIVLVEGGCCAFS